MRYRTSVGMTRRRRGSRMQRQSHSSRSRMNGSGARRTSPDHTSRAPPSAAATFMPDASRSCLWLYIHFSCRGEPRHTISSTAPERLIISAVLRSSAAPPNPSRTPHILSPGDDLSVVLLPFQPLPVFRREEKRRLRFLPRSRAVHIRSRSQRRVHEAVLKAFLRRR